MFCCEGRSFGQENNFGSLGTKTPMELQQRNEKLMAALDKFTSNPEDMQACRELWDLLDPQRNREWYQLNSEMQKLEAQVRSIGMPCANGYGTTYPPGTFQQPQNQGSPYSGVRVESYGMGADFCVDIDRAGKTGNQGYDSFSGQLKSLESQYNQARNSSSQAMSNFNNMVGGNMGDVMGMFSGEGGSNEGPGGSGGGGLICSKCGERYTVDALIIGPKLCDDCRRLEIDGDSPEPVGVYHDVPPYDLGVNGNLDDQPYPNVGLESDSPPDGPHCPPDGPPCPFNGCESFVHNNPFCWNSSQCAIDNFPGFPSPHNGFNQTLMQNEDVLVEANLQLVEKTICANSRTCHSCCGDPGFKWVKHYVGVAAFRYELTLTVRLLSDKKIFFKGFAELWNGDMNLDKIIPPFGCVDSFQLWDKASYNFGTSFAMDPVNRRIFTYTGYQWTGYNNPHIVYSFGYDIVR